MTVEDLREEYLFLTGTRMPEEAEENGWPVRHDHCFQRIVLDVVAGGHWRDHISAPAYKNLTEQQLLLAVSLSRFILQRPHALPQMNELSLQYRGKA